ncbi:hypothetical protein B7494_g6080 [Chlorociboria aeruginascens]|nr:hypothetical protein B7494_g6080 [Chlorociboria aeruginascens]
MSANTVHVKNISAQTSEKDVKDFFSFCGKITSLEITKSGETQNATVTFEKETAAKTALLLDNTQLGSTQVKVTSATGSTEDDGSHFTNQTERDSDEITQEEKPRSRIIAEYLAHGYVIGDQAAQRAIDLDQKHGVSNRFLSTLQSIDQKYHATDRAKSVDQSYGVTAKTNSLWSGLTSYYEKAAGTPTGQKLVNFYTQTSRQVQDIHAEARRLADLKKQEGAASGVHKTTRKYGFDFESDVKVPETCKPPCDCGGEARKCICAPENCPTSKVESQVSARMRSRNISFTDKTTCKCHGNQQACICETGKCACASCPKAETGSAATTSKSQKVSDIDKTTS